MSKELSLDDIREDLRKKPNSIDMNVVPVEEISKIVEEKAALKQPKVVDAVNLASQFDRSKDSLDVDAAIIEDDVPIQEEIDKTEPINDKFIQDVAELKPVNEDDMDSIINDMIEEEAKDSIPKAVEEVKDKIEELDEDNLELDDNALYEKKEEERRREETDKENNRRWSELQDSFKENILNKNQDNLKEFRISKTPISINKIFTQDLTQSKVSVWGLYYSGIPIVMSELGGAEMGLIIPESDNDTIDDLILFTTLHKHTEDKNKGTLEEWLKKFTYLDLQDLMFAIYKATFKNANYTYYNCPNDKCKKVFMADMDIKDMVVYPDKETEDRMKRILAKDPTSRNIVTKKIIQPSQDIAVSVSMPSIYKALFENKMISEDFKKKNPSLSNVLMYIDDIFYKDRDSKLLCPIDCRPDPDDLNKTVQRKTAIYSRIINRLDLEQYQYLVSELIKYINTFSRNKITYQFPETKCPDCGTTIPAQPMDPTRMLFFRQRLGQAVLNFTPGS